MLFSPEPKTRREDLYDFNRELSALVTALRAERLTLVTGLRRTGKTSLLQGSPRQGQYTPPLR